MAVLKPTFLPPLFCPNPADNSPAQADERWLASATGLWLGVGQAVDVLNTRFNDLSLQAAYHAEAEAWLRLALPGLQGLREAKLAALAAQQQGQPAPSGEGAQEPGAADPTAAGDALAEPAPQPPADAAAT